MSVEESKWMKKGFFSVEMERLRVFYFFTPCQLLGKGFFFFFRFFLQESSFMGFIGLPRMVFVLFIDRNEFFFWRKHFCNAFRDLFVNLLGILSHLNFNFFKFKKKIKN